MCGNRVEERETRVQELEASVEGLTDELVECKVRIRELENTVDEQSGFSRSPPEQAGEKPAESRNDQPAEETTASEDTEETTTESEILVPEADTPNTEAPEDADNETSDAEAESEAEEESGSDIIVA